jgi:predicted dehydrogenase
MPVLPLVDQAGSLAELLDAVRAGRQPESSGRENLGSLALALAAIESAEGGEPVTL